MMCRHRFLLRGQGRRTCQSSGMETIGDISVWLISVIIIVLFLWLRADIRVLEGRFEKRIDGLEERFDKRFDGMDERIRTLEAGQAEIKGQLAIIHDYNLHRNLGEPEGAPEAAPGD